MLAIREKNEADDQLISAFLLDSPQQISAARRSYDPSQQQEDDDDNDSSDDEFEFAIARAESGTGFTISADEIFSNGRILPVYSRMEAKEAKRLPIEDRGSGVADLEDGSYCVWAPQSSPDIWRKSRSTGSSSSSKRWHFRDLVSSGCHSDGRLKVAFMDRNPNPKAGSEVVSRRSGKGKETEMDLVTAHRLFYGQGSGQGSRRSYLPYRRELMVGLYAGRGFSEVPSSRSRSMRG